MALPYRQERLLRRTDRALRQSDPDLASMLSIFARITASERLPAWEQLRPKLTWAWRILLWPVGAAAFLVVFAAGGGSKAAMACSAAVHGRAMRLCLSPFRRGYGRSRLLLAACPVSLGHEVADNHGRNSRLLR
jgi:hypothetical protein